MTRGRGAAAVAAALATAAALAAAGCGGDDAGGSGATGGHGTAPAAWVKSARFTGRFPADLNALCHARDAYERLHEPGDSADAAQNAAFLDRLAVASEDLGRAIGELDAPARLAEDTAAARNALDGIAALQREAASRMREAGVEAAEPLFARLAAVARPFDELARRAPAPDCVIGAS